MSCAFWHIERLPIITSCVVLDENIDTCLATGFFSMHGVLGKRCLVGEEDTLWHHWLPECVAAKRDSEDNRICEGTVAFERRKWRRSHSIV